MKSDRAKSYEAGGGKFAHIARIVVEQEGNEAPWLHLYAHNGKEHLEQVNIALVHRPKDREMKPADLHDAVRVSIEVGAKKIIMV